MTRRSRSGALVLAAIACARHGGGALRIREGLLGAAAVTALYLASLLVVTPFQPGNPAAAASLLDLDVRQQGQVLLSAFGAVPASARSWSACDGISGRVRLGALAPLLLRSARSSSSTWPR